MNTCFERPDDFIPERWYSKPDMVKDKRAFAPFGIGKAQVNAQGPYGWQKLLLLLMPAIGRYNCPGKPLATAELSFVAASLVKQYYIRMTPDEMGMRVKEDMKDQLAAFPGSLHLIFDSRS